MACMHVEVEGVCAIVCGVKGPKRCAFCGDRSTVLCDWPTVKSVYCDVSKLKPADVIKLGGKFKGKWLKLTVARPEFGGYMHLEWKIESGVTVAQA